MHVLICDDEQDMQLLLQLTAESLGFTASAVGNAQAAIDACRTRPPDVLVLDVAMPEVDGPALLRKLRDERLEPDQTLLVSAIPPGELAQLATELGVQWLPKPCTYTEFADRLHTLTS